MRVLVTGATGFIGAPVVRELCSRGCEVVALSRRTGCDLFAGLPVRLLTGDLLRAYDLKSEIERLRPEVCVHLAWHVDPKDYSTSLSNLRMLVAALEFAEILAGAGCQRLVGAGTNFEYAAAGVPVAEDAPTDPNSLYAASKLGLFHVLRQFARLRGMSFAWARIFFLFGPREAPGRLVPAVILALLRGEQARVTAGEQVRDFLHVEDAARAIADVVLGNLEGPVNVASGIPVQVKDVVSTIADLLGCPSLVSFGALPYREGDPMFVCADVSKLRGATGFAPRVDLRSGLDGTISWWREHPGGGEGH